MTEHSVSVAEHGTDRNIMYVYCTCGWEHPRPVRWATAQRLAVEHSNANVATLTTGATV